MKRGYLVMRCSRIETTDGNQLEFEDKDCLGVMFIFRTKKAARNRYGKNVPLLKVELPNA